MSIWNIDNNTLYNEQYDIINKNNIKILEEMKNFIIKDENINIVAKGPSSKYIENGHAINQACIFTNKKFVYMNDFHSIFGIEKYIKDIKYIFIPDTPHVYGHPYKEITYIDFLNYLKLYNFNGNVFIYKIQTSKLPLFPYFKKYLFNSISTTDIPIQIINRFFNINKFITHGYKMSDSSLYHKDFLIIYEKKNDRIKSLEWILNIIKQKNIQYVNDIIYKFNKLEKIFGTKKFVLQKQENNPIIENMNNIQLLKY